MRTSNYNFDIDKHSLIKPVVIIRSGDHDIDTIKITLSNQGEPVDLTNATVKFMGTTPAGNKIIDDVHTKIVDAASGIFEYTFPSAAGSSVGEYQDAYFSIILANGQSSTMDFRVQVLSGVDISAPVASEYITHYDTMVTELNSAYDSFVNETDEKMASTVSSLATSAATVLDSALARVNDVDSTANSASSAASNAVSMAASVASTVTSQASYINSVASSAASSVSSVAATVVDKLNNISVGGRNLLTGTSGELQTKQFTNSWNVGPQATNGNYKIKLVSGQTYTYRVWIDNTNGPDVAFTNVRFNPIGGTEYNLGNGSSIAQGQTGYSTLSMTPSQDGYACFIPFAYGAIENFSAGWKEEKLEKGNVPTDWTPAPEDLSPKLDIGGRNYLLNSSGDTLSGWGNADNIWSITSDQTRGNVFTTTPTTAWTGGGVNSIYQTINKKIAGHQVTVSFWAKSSVNGAKLHSEPQGGGNAFNTTLTTDWARYSYTISNFTDKIYLMAVDAGTAYYIDDIKLETGNIATDWTPAPEDMASATGRGKILDGADLNNYTEPYKYVIEGATNIANYPSGANVWAILEVDKINSATFTQKITDTDNRVFLRTYAGARPVWSAWIQLSNDGNVLHKTGNETAAGDKTFTGKVAVAGTLDAVQKVYSRTIGSTNDLLINYTRVGNLVTGRYNTKFGGTFPLGANDGYKSPSAYPVNVISYNANAWFMPDNTFHADTASTGNFMFVTNDPLPSN